MKEHLIKYLYWLMILFVLVITTYVLVNWLIPLFFSCLIVLILQPLLTREINLLKIKNNLLAKAVIIFNKIINNRTSSNSSDFITELHAFTVGKICII